MSLSRRPALVFEVFPLLIPILKHGAYHRDAARVLAYVAETFPFETRSAVRSGYADDDLEAVSPFLSRLGRSDSSVATGDVYTLQALPDETTEVSIPPWMRRLTERGSQTRPAGDAEEHGPAFDRLDRLRSAVAHETSLRDPTITEDVVLRVGVGIHRLTAERDGESRAYTLKRYGRREVSTEIAQRFDEAMREWHRVDHPGVADLLAWHVQPVPWVLVEYLDAPLRIRAEDLGRRSIRRELYATIDLVEALHNLDTAHRSLFPGAVFARDHLWSDDASTTLIDWGLPLSLQKLIGSARGLDLRFAAPEQLHPGAYGDDNHYTDIYQLGALAFWMVTGRPPFRATPPELLQRMFATSPPSPTEIRPSLPQAIDAVFDRVLAKEKVNRYASASAFGRDLRGVLEDER